MSRTFQIRSNGFCFLWALARFQWKKLPHYNRGLCRAFTGHDQIGTILADLWPVGMLVGAIAVLLTS